LLSVFIRFDRSLAPSIAAAAATHVGARPTAKHLARCSIRIAPASAKPAHTREWEVDISGTWYNELNSTMKITVKGKALTGHYVSAVGEAKGRTVPLFSRIDEAGSRRASR
jgi:hypothetical protein